MARSHAVVASLLTAAVLSACTTASDDGKPNLVLVTTTLAPTTTIEGAESAADAAPLRSVCPSTVSVQLDSTFDVWALPWVAMVAIDGPASGGVYSGLMVDPETREPTGIVLELRTASVVRPVAADGVAPTSGEIARSVLDAAGADPTLLFAVVGTDSVALARQRGLDFVLAPWERSDVALQWSRSAAPGALVASEIADPTLRADRRDAAVAYLIEQGVVPADDVATDRGAIEIVRLLDQPERSLEPLGTRTWQLLDDFGWSPYPHAVAASIKNLESRKDCIKAMVSMLQRSVIAVANDPDRFAANLAVIATRAGVANDQARVVAQVRAARTLGVLGDGTNDVIGDLTRSRLEQMLRASNVAAKRIGGPTVDGDDVERVARDVLSVLWDTRIGVDRVPD
jgi:hypothetical protein